MTLVMSHPEFFMASRFFTDQRDFLGDPSL